MANDDERDRPRGINNLNLRDDIVDEIPSELPEQMGGQGLPVLLPGTNIFRIPSNVVQLVEPIDEVLLDADGQPIPDPADPNKGRIVQRLQIIFDKDNPLLVVGGEHDGQPVGTRINNRPRNRARKTEARIMVSDMTYLFRESLGYTGPLSRNSEWAVAIEWAAGRIFRAEHGLSAYCSPDRIRFVNDPSDPTYRASIADPTGMKGCGKRYYTSNFKMPAQNGQPSGYSEIKYCTCEAKLRGFFQFERFLKPTAAMQAEAEGAVPF